MKRTQLMTLGLATVLLASVSLTARAQVPSTVDGFWVIDLTADDVSVKKGAASFGERALIEFGKLTAEAFSYYGFPTKDLVVLNPTPYTFEVVMAAEKFGSIRWYGVRQSATRITGTLSWTRDDGAVWNYTFVADKSTPPSDEY
jgi:hypothetical protein